MTGSDIHVQTDVARLLHLVLDQSFLPSSATANLGRRQIMMAWSKVLWVLLESLENIGLHDKGPASSGALGFNSSQFISLS